MPWEVGKIHIQIGEVRTLDVDNWQIIPDDRQQQVEIIGGVAVQDFGHIESGDKISCNVTVRVGGWQEICRYWNSRQLVQITDEGGTVWSNMRVVVKSYQYVSRFPKAVKATLEFWRL